MLLTAIEALRGGERYALHFEDGYKLEVFDAVIARFGLHAGMELLPDELEEIGRQSAAAGARARAARIMGRRQISKKELFTRLVKDGESEQDAAAAADWMESAGVVNDGQYASMLVRHYAAKGYGPEKIKNELYRRGVDRELWERAMEQMQGAEAVDRYIEKSLRGAVPEKKDIARLSNALFRRGFGWDEIKAALQRYYAMEEQD
jgi:regulatory protein